MDMTGEHRISAPRQKVWEALNDPEILRASIPGCEALEKTSETEMNASVTAKIGPVKAKFKGEVTLEDLNPPESYRIVGEGKGGVAGFAKGAADVKLTEDGDGTLLSYVVKAQVGGKLAQLGSRLIDTTARKMADEFFKSFSAQVGGAADDGAESGGTEPDPGLIEEARSLANEHAVEEVEHAVEDAVHHAEESVERAATKGVLGGPMMWGLLALLVVIALLGVMSS